MIMCSNCLLSRRGMLAGGAALFAATAVAGRAFGQDAAPAPQNAISGDAALERLMAGNARYVANAPNERDFSAGRAARALKQYPIVAVLSCSDSRVAPELAFDQGPGDVFVVRVAGNFLNNDGLASLEYAVRFLGAPLIMVLGHGNCGAIDAAIKVVRDKIELPGHLPELIRELKPAVDVAIKSGEKDLLGAAITANVRLVTEEIAGAGPILAPLAKDKKIKVVGGVYDLASGRVGLL
jgi:carbonic anhydrase